MKLEGPERSIARVSTQVAWPWYARPLIPTFGFLFAMATASHAFAAGLFASGLWALAVVVVLVISLVLPRRLSSYRKTVSGGVRADLTGLYLNDRRIVDIVRIRTAYTRIDSRQQSSLVLCERALIHEVCVDPAECTRLLSRMNLTSNCSVGEFAMLVGSSRDVSRRTALSLIAGAVLAVVLIALGGSALILVLPCIAFVLNAILSHVTVRVGTDGVSIRSRIMKKRTLTFSQLRDVYRAGSDLVLRTTANDLIVITEYPRAGMASNRIPGELDALERRIQERLAARHALTTLAGGTLTESHVGAIEFRRDSHTLFRTGAVSSEILWRIVEDVSSPSIRTAAAGALADDLDDAGRERLRVLANASVVPKVRIALSAIADGEASLDVLDIGESGETRPARRIARTQ